MSACFSTTDCFLLRDPSPSPLNELSHSASWWADREEHREQGDSLRVGQNEVNEIDECFYFWGCGELNLYFVGTTK